jgi:hypothetical protein
MTSSKPACLLHATISSPISEVKSEKQVRDFSEVGNISNQGLQQLNNLPVRNVRSASITVAVENLLFSGLTTTTAFPSSSLVPSDLYGQNVSDSKKYRLTDKKNGCPPNIIGYASSLFRINH